MFNRRQKRTYFQNGLRRGFKFGRCEPLEPRNMLAGHPLAAPVIAHAAPPTPPALHAAAPIAGGHTAPGGAQAPSSQLTVLTATLADPNDASSSGTVTYDTGTICGTATTELSISVTDAAASSSLSVSIGGVTVGTITTDSNGDGTLVLSSNPTGSQQSLPSNFPTSVAAGAAVTVGTLAGTLAVPTAGSMPGGCGQNQGVSLTAALSDTSAGAAGTATFTSSGKYGATNTTFSVSVTGAAASSTLNVSIGGVVVGTITTDSNGDGTLVLSSNPTGSQQSLPANFPTNVSAGTTVTVGTLSGTFATSSSNSSGSIVASSIKHR